MAVFTEKSTMIANRDATPKVLTDAFVANGELLEAEGFITTGSAADSAGSKYLMNSVPSNSRVTSVIMQSDAMGGSAAVNVGVYYPSFIPKGAGLDAIVPNSVINASFFASAQSVVTALGPTEVINQSGNNTIAKQEMPLWQALGLAFDPNIELDIVITVSTVLAASGNMALKTRYCKQ